PGSYLEQPLMEIFQKIIDKFHGKGLLYKIIESSIQGLAGGVAIVLPYLVPFLLGLAFLEDIGYLPRIAFLLDAFMHKIGLHGKSAFPFILSYGCTVPGIMGSRILESRRDRFITIILSTMIPCSARMTIIFGLVAYFIGPLAALFIYIFNLLIISIAGKILSKILPEISPGLIIEMPAYKVPNLKVVLAKTWLRMKDFIIIAWPILIGGSIILSLLNYYDFEKYINYILSPVTKSLGLPVIIGTTLIFGILRKELSMIMLIQVFNTPDISSVMTNAQIFIFTIFVVFYIPCLATVAVMLKEIGFKRTVFSIIITLIIAYTVSLMFRFVLTLL
ncbi:ferrous iron transport protein B, partial [candidate division KSB1 bacterium]